MERLERLERQPADAFIALLVKRNNVWYASDLRSTGMTLTGAGAGLELAADTPTTGGS